ncbi:MAG TPA: hypothetical protein P5086_11210 [Prolixibacteraceae bacterium]|nr:hypothetical protein [Prolixibacteraceae bacterium]HRV89869.1 hypothetical protein [Prolixibacteraceae bacterium]
MLQLKIRPELFWDLDKSKLSEYRNQRIIIERVLSLGNIQEFKEIIQFYGMETIRKEIAKAGSLDPKTLEFVLTFLKINKKELLCCTRKQSTPSFWM